MKHIEFTLAAMLSLTVASVAIAATQPKGATRHTIEANAKVKDTPPFSDQQDFDDAQRGLIHKPDTLTITTADGNPVWDLEEYKSFIQCDEDQCDQAAPDTVNPSLWRNAQLNMQYGLFKVTENIYQVRGYDLSNITFIQGGTGWIVLDPLISSETAKEALKLINERLGERPVAVIVYSHSHIDHYGGAVGLVSQAEVDDKKVIIIAPEHFTEHAVSENVIAGNAMQRRSVYMYGTLLPRNATGGVSSGLGMTTSTGTTGLLLPTQEVKETGESIIIPGAGDIGDVEMVFQMTPGTEAPAEMNIWFPKWNALFMAENTTNTMHNILTLRGAPVRDALKWSSFINETIEMWGDKAVVKFQSHHWPVWDNDRIIPYLNKQRDIYKFIHDQSVRLMNQGYNGEEISEMIKLPPALENNWATRGYYGTLRHNSRAVYQRYMGWYNGNPSDLNNLPQEMVATKYLEFMGGGDEVIKKAGDSFDKGEYRWVAEVMKHVVFADPDNTTAKELLADAYEQLGYQAESGSWRAVYLQGAHELRNGVPSEGGTLITAPIAAMTMDLFFDYLAVRLNADKAVGQVFSINIDFIDPSDLTDIPSYYTLTVENSVLNHNTREQGDNADADVSLVMTLKTLNDIQLGNTTFDDAIASGDVDLVESDPEAQIFDKFLWMLDDFDVWFNIVTP